MSQSPFEGTRVLERLVEIGKLDEFYEAVDSDNLGAAKALMKRAQIDSDTIAEVLRRMSEADSE